MKDKITASEALFAFIAWLTARQEKITMSASNDAAEPLELVTSFCLENNLEAPRENYTDFYKLPKSPDKIIGENG